LLKINLSSAATDRASSLARGSSLILIWVAIRVKVSLLVYL
jgi:hypothetical protein